MRDLKNLSTLKLDYQLIGKCIYEARRNKGLTQEVLSELCDCSPNHLSKVETGKVGISLELIYRLSVILEEPVDYFLKGNYHSDSKFIIDNVLAEKLNQLDSKTLVFAEEIVNALIRYRNWIND